MCYIRVVKNPPFYKGQNVWENNIGILQTFLRRNALNSKYGSYKIIHFKTTVN